MEDKHLWLILYFLLGLVYITARHTPARYEKFLAELKKMNAGYPPVLVSAVVTVGFVIAFSVWPIPFFLFLRRKFKGEKDPFS